MIKLPDFKKRRILVVGDIILDRFVFGEVSRISQEAPVPVLKAMKEVFKAGGAANVAVNLAALGAKTVLCGALGKDFYGDFSISHLKKHGIITSSVVRLPLYTTTLKTRIIARKQQVVRVDREEKLNGNSSATLIKKLKKEIIKADAVIIADYGKGVITKKLLSYLIPAAAGLKKIITVDPQVEHFMNYKNVTSLTPNHFEAEKATNMRAASDSEVKKAGFAVMKKLKPESLLITRGASGMAIFEKGKVTFIKTLAREVFDVTGAGDTVIAVFTSALCSGMSTLESAKLANKAAGIVVGKLGTATVSKRELEK
ncbi:MAG: D-glycero-beta-D-manno-heptose-7-phosphate kinase [Elusimicrobiota bacterium]|nr:D-glycero-beta-D-manno-heptose-7-phosphate kinase [Elusimicrobiota bacterium]